jgi:prevent-host-death family protein
LYILYKTYKSEVPVPENEISVAYAREHFAEYVSKVAYTKDRIVVTKHGKKVAAFVPYEDLEWLEEMENTIDLKEAKKAMAEMKRSGKKGTVPFRQVVKELGL